VHRNAQGALQNLENPKDERKRISRFYRSGFGVPKQFSYTMMHDGFCLLLTESEKDPSFSCSNAFRS